MKHRLFFLIVSGEAPNEISNLQLSESFIPRFTGKTALKSTLTFKTLFFVHNIIQRVLKALTPLKNWFVFFINRNAELCSQVSSEELR